MKPQMVSGSGSAGSAGLALPMVSKERKLASSSAGKAMQ